MAPTWDLTGIHPCRLSFGYLTQSQENQDVAVVGVVSAALEVHQTGIVLSCACLSRVVISSTILSQSSQNVVLFPSLTGYPFEPRTKLYIVRALPSIGRIQSS